jgi:hypothetical protein
MHSGTQQNKHISNAPTNNPAIIPTKSIELFLYRLFIASIKFLVSVVSSSVDFSDLQTRFATSDM